jgi:hypothetical protein
MVERDDMAPPTAEHVLQGLEDVLVLPPAGPQDAGEDGVGLRTSLGPVPRRHLPRHHRRADFTLRPVVRRVHRVVV